MNEYQSKRAIIIFGDICEFGSFIQRVNHPQTQLFPFWKSWENLRDHYQDKTKFFMKRLGDGFMVVAELENKNIVNSVCYILDETWDLATKCQSLIVNKSNPKPDGFRIRLTFDYIWKLPCRQFKYDYIADKINLAEKLLYVEKPMLMVCHEAIKEIIPDSIASEKGYIFNKLNVAEDSNHSIYNQDFKHLWSFNKIKKPSE